MAQNYVQPGEHITIAASPYAVSGGGGVLVGQLFGVAQGDAENGAEVVIGCVGVYRLAKVSAQAIAVGAPVYWDDALKLVTGDAEEGANPLIGVAVSAAANPSPTINVRLNGAVATVNIITEEP